MLIVAILAGLAWAATVTGTATRGLDVALTLVLGLTAFNVVGSAFGDFGTLDAAGGPPSPAGSWRQAARGRPRRGVCRSGRSRPKTKRGRTADLAAALRNTRL